ncbi:MAG TPA: hypothetical protein VN618_04240 [Solirubrobacteraceae bacterium]|nr:hypothetical protein [Solirubrobacteraceae bacterium]
MSSSTIGPLLSAVSLLLAAFGFVYNTQKDRIDAVLDDADVPADVNTRASKRRRAQSARNSATWLLVAALLMWVLLLKEIEHKAAAAFKHDFAPSTYSTVDAVFFVAANAWLVIAIFIAIRVTKLADRVGKLKS